MKKAIKLIAIIVSILIVIIGSLTYSYKVLATDTGGINPLDDVENGTFWDKSYTLGTKISDITVGLGIFHKYGQCLGHIYTFNEIGKPSGTGDYVLQMVIEVNPDKKENDSTYEDVEGNDYVVIKNYNSGDSKITKFHGSDIARGIAIGATYQALNGSYTEFPTNVQQSGDWWYLANWTDPTLPEYWKNCSRGGTELLKLWATDSNGKLYQDYFEPLWYAKYDVKTLDNGRKVYKWGDYVDSQYGVNGEWKAGHIGARVMNYAIHKGIIQDWNLKVGEYYNAFDGGSNNGTNYLISDIVDEDSYNREEIQNMIKKSWTTSIDPKIEEKTDIAAPTFITNNQGTYIGPYAINTVKDSSNRLSCKINKVTIEYEGKTETVTRWATKNGNRFREYSGVSMLSSMANGSEIYFKVSEAKPIKKIKVYANGPEIYKAKVLVSGYSFNTTSYQQQITACYAIPTIENGGKTKKETSIELRIPNYTGSLLIKKTDSKTGATVSNAQFIIKYDSILSKEEAEGIDFSEIEKNCKNKYITKVNNKVIQDFKDYNYKDYFTEDVGQATIYVTGAEGKVSVNNIVRGVYHIYEKATNEKYYLKDQGTIVTIGGKEYLDCGTIKIKETGVIEKSIQNKPTRGNFEIEKVNKNNPAEKLSKVKFKFKLEPNGINGNLSGWLTNGDLLTKKLEETVTGDINKAGEFMTDANGKISLKGVPAGTYSIYETEEGEKKRI